MATEPGEILGGYEDLPEPIKERDTQAEEMPKQRKDEREADAKVPARQEDVISTPNGIEKDGDTLHVVEKDLDEFVDSVAEAAPSRLPERWPEEAKQGLEKTATKSPRAELIAEKVLKAEKLPEKAPRAEKSPAREKTPEPKASRPEKTPRVEKIVRAEKPLEKTRPAAPATPKPMKRKMEPRGKDTVPWEGLTLNKCLLVASFVALLSVGCQVFQEFVEYSETVLTAELSAWTSEEGSGGELDERWFYEKWLDWSDDEELLEMEEEEEEEEEEEDDVVLEMEEEEEEEDDTVLEMEEEEEEEEPVAAETEEKEEEAELVPASKGSPKKRQEKAVKREKVSRGKARRGRELAGNRREEEEEEEEEEEGKETQPQGRRHRREGKAERPRRKEEEEKRHHRKEVQREGRGRGKGRPKPERDSHDPKAAPRPASLLPKEGAYKFRRHRAQEGWRHD